LLGSQDANVLDKMPRSLQPVAKHQLHEIYLASTRAEAFKAFDLFVGTYQAKYPKAVDCLLKDRESLMAFYDFPAEHWRKLNGSALLPEVIKGVQFVDGVRKAA